MKKSESVGDAETPTPVRLYQTNKNFDNQWVYPSENQSFMQELIDRFHLPPAIARLFISRKFESADAVHRFLFGQLPDLHRPFLFSQMRRAVKRIMEAKEYNQSIMVFGDNDVDGMTGTTLLCQFLNHIGIKTFFRLADPKSTRATMILDVLPVLKKHDCKLLITVDCGITANSELKQISREGVDVIITDHHEPSAELPRVHAILNPKVEGDRYPNKQITGVGVAFKFAHAITEHMIKHRKLPKDYVDLKDYLDLVAMGTVADMAPLTEENRILVRYGLKKMSQSPRIGLTKLMEVAEVQSKDVDTTIIASKIAPRLNSLGRIADPHKGVELLLVDNPDQAEVMAQELDLFNLERQKIERTMTVDVEAMFDTTPQILKNHAIVLSSDQWHSGVIAILSTRISKMFNRPTIFLAIENGVAKGSLRSIPNFPLLSILKQCSHLLINYGGHDYAAGLSLEEKNIEEFKKFFIGKANESLSDEDVTPKLYLDAPISFTDLTFDLMEAIQLIAPFGNDNLPPVFYTTVHQKRPPKIIGKNHIKLYLVHEGLQLEAIGFGFADKLDELKEIGNASFDVAFTPQVNEFQQKDSIQLILRDYKLKPIVTIDTI